MSSALPVYDTISGREWMRLWLLILKNGQCLQFDIDERGIPLATAFNNIHAINRVAYITGRRYEARYLGKGILGVIGRISEGAPLADPALRYRSVLREYAKLKSGGTSLALKGGSRP